MSSQYEERSGGHAESVAIKIFVSIIVVMGVLVTIKCLRRVANGPPRASATTAAATTPLDSSRSAVAPASIVVTSLPTFVHRAPPKSSPEEEEEDRRLECAVCLTEFEEGEEGRVLPSCCHKFHTECVTQWFLSNTTCPLCRSSVELPV